MQKKKLKQRELKMQKSEREPKEDLKEEKEKREIIQIVKTTLKSNQKVENFTFLNKLIFGFI